MGKKPKYTRTKLPEIGNANSLPIDKVASGLYKHGNHAPLIKRQDIIQTAEHFKEAGVHGEELAIRVSNSCGLNKGWTETFLLERGIIRRKRRPNRRKLPNLTRMTFCDLLRHTFDKVLTTEEKALIRIETKGGKIELMGDREDLKSKVMDAFAREFRRRNGRQLAKAK